MLLKSILRKFYCSCFATQRKNEHIFTRIYQQGLWGKDSKGEGTSGPGSYVYNALPYIDYLQKFLKQYDIQSVVDVGCGDWRLSQHIDWEDRSYVGIDVVKKIIKKNQKSFFSPKRTFIHGDFQNIDLPKGDLLICKDVLQHLSNKEVQQFTHHIAKFKHCLITNDVEMFSRSSLNNDIRNGQWRTLDLTQPPFELRGSKELTYRSSHATKQILHIQK